MGVCIYIHTHVCGLSRKCPAMQYEYEVCVCVYIIHTHKLTISVPGKMTKTIHSERQDV